MDHAPVTINISSHKRRIPHMADSKKKAEPPKGVTIPVNPVLLALANNMLTNEEIKEAVESGKKAREAKIPKKPVEKE
jgi:hypothetical protein